MTAITAARSDTGTNGGVISNHPMHNRTTVTRSANGKYDVTLTTRIGTEPMNWDAVEGLLVSMITAQMQRERAQMQAAGN